ncbi:MAG TPA: cupredoxin domain-containing protein [Actinomycetota bacterium]|nr:cupredoxin domain-containing protein [Actinomycetota bacterium]
MRRAALVVGLLTLLATACGGGRQEGGAASPAPPPVQLQGRVNDHGTKDLGSATELEMKLDDFYFGPTFVEASPGATVTVELENEGDVPHTFTVESLGVDETLQPGDRKEVQLTLPQSGVVNFICRFHVGQGMQGAFFFGAGAMTQPASGQSTGSYGY